MSDNRELYTLPEVVQGATADDVTFEIIKNSVPINLTGATITLKFVPFNSKVPVAELTVGDGLTIVNALAGQFKINKAVINWRPNTYLGDWDITTADGYKHNYVRLKRVVTRNY